MNNMDKISARKNPVAFMQSIGFDMDGLPESLRGGYARWWLFGIPAGSFLQAVIEGDLYDAMANANETNRARLFEVVCWFWNNADARCIRKNAKSWGEAGGHFGRMAERAGEGQTNGL